MLIIRDRHDTFGLGALGGSLGPFWVFFRLSWLHFGSSWLLFGVSWGSLGFLLDGLEALVATDYVLQGVPKLRSKKIRISNVDFSKM